MIDPQTFAGIGGGYPSGAGIADMALVEQLNKALTSGYGTDAAAYTGGRALQPESLENSLMTTTFEMKDEFVLCRGSPVWSTCGTRDRIMAGVATAAP